MPGAVLSILHVSSDLIIALRERILCPIFMLEFYLKTTRQIRGNMCSIFPEVMHLDGTMESRTWAFLVTLASASSFLLQFEKGAQIVRMGTGRPDTDSDSRQKWRNTEFEESRLIDI